MNTDRAIAAFSALAHPHRLNVFRALVRAAPGKVSAGELARKVGAPPSTLSAHLAQLQRSGLIRATRERQSILYSLDEEGARRLIAYLVDDCCGGHPEICGMAAAREDAATTA
jgi:DNA-binding transcriptional ArsR family regulator